MTNKEKRMTFKYFSFPFSNICPRIFAPFLQVKRERKWMCSRKKHLKKMFPPACEFGVWKNVRKFTITTLRRKNVLVVNTELRGTAPNAALRRTRLLCRLYLVQVAPGRYWKFACIRKSKRIFPNEISFEHDAKLWMSVSRFTNLNQCWLDFRTSNHLRK